MTKNTDLFSSVFLKYGQLDLSKASINIISNYLTLIFSENFWILCAWVLFFRPFLMLTQKLPLSFSSRKYQHNLTQLDLNRVVGTCGRAAAGENIKSDVAFHSDLCFTPPRLWITWIFSCSPRESMMIKSNKVIWGPLARVRSGQISYSNKWARSPNQSISTLHISIWYEIMWFIFVLFVYFLTRRHSVTDRISTERKRDILQNSFFVDWCGEPRGVTLVGWRLRVSQLAACPH